MCGACCTYCQVYQNAEDLGQPGKNTSEANHNATLFLGLLCTLLTCVLPFASIALLRKEARQRYNIEVSS